MAKRLQGIIFSDVAPEDKNTLWLRSDSNGRIFMFVFGNNGWTQVGGSRNDVLPPNSDPIE